MKERCGICGGSKDSIHHNIGVLGSHRFIEIAGADLPSKWEVDAELGKARAAIENLEMYLKVLHRHLYEDQP